MEYSSGVIANVHFFVTDVIAGLAESERENMCYFVQFIEDWSMTNRIVLKESCFMNILQASGLYAYNLISKDFMKERSVLCALWVIFFEFTE
jgi:hypothetical protein